MGAKRSVRRVDAVCMVVDSGIEFHFEQEVGQAEAAKGHQDVECESTEGHYICGPPAPRVPVCYPARSSGNQVNLQENTGTDKINGK